MLSGKVDATLGAFWNVEGVELRQRRQRPWIAPVDRLGVPDYDELVLVANEDDVEDKPRRPAPVHLGASRGARAQAREDPAGAARPCSTPTTTCAGARPAPACALTIPALFPEQRDQPFGLPRPGEVAQLRRLDGRQRPARQDARRERGAHERAAAGRRALSRARGSGRCRAGATSTEERARADHDASACHDRAAQLAPAAAADPRPPASADARRRATTTAPAVTPPATATGPRGSGSASSSLRRGSSAVTGRATGTGAFFSSPLGLAADIEGAV